MKMLLKEKGILVILHNWGEFRVKGQNHTLESRLQSLGLNWSKQPKINQKITKTRT
jgi:hypothetical protein